MNIIARKKIHPSFNLPSASDFEEILGTFSGSQELTLNLCEPLRQLSVASSSRFRAQLVQLCFSLSRELPLTKCNRTGVSTGEKLAELVEAIHAASLIIDDIQDDSRFRRGEPAVHTKIGVSRAINSATMLYFWALKMIPKMDLENSVRLELHEICIDSLMRGHFGQALDLSVEIDTVDSNRAYILSTKSIELKTGALISLAAELGSIAGGASLHVRNSLKQFGQEFGFALQCFNDLGEFSKSRQAVSQDLLLGRPSWIWACATEFMSNAEYTNFKLSIKCLRSASYTNSIIQMNYLKTHPLIKFAREEAQKLMENCVQKIFDNLSVEIVDLDSRTDWQTLKKMASEVTKAYD